MLLQLEITKFFLRIGLNYDDFSKEVRDVLKSIDFALVLTELTQNEIEFATLFQGDHLV